MFNIGGFSFDISFINSPLNLRFIYYNKTIKFVNASYLIKWLFPVMDQTILTLL